MFAVTLVYNTRRSGEFLLGGLVATLRSDRWHRARLREMAETYGTKATLVLVDGALHETEASAV